MNLLLDTCSFLWITLDPTQFSSQALLLFQDPANRVFLSAVSAWEIAVKYGLGNFSYSNRPKSLSLSREWHTRLRNCC